MRTKKNAKWPGSSEETRQFTLFSESTKFVFSMNSVIHLNQKQDIFAGWSECDTKRIIIVRVFLL